MPREACIHLETMKPCFPPSQDGFDPEGCVGEISSLYIMSKKYEGEFSTAHRPVVCTFTVSVAIDRPIMDNLHATRSYRYLNSRESA